MSYLVVSLIFLSVVMFTLSVHFVSVSMGEEKCDPVVTSNNMTTGIVLTVLSIMLFVATVVYSYFYEKPASF